jgi:hypothetical protein
MNIIKRVLHLLPFVHFYGPWEDINSPECIGHWHQVRRCTVCNRGQRRWEDSSGFR